MITWAKVVRVLLCCLCVGPIWSWWGVGFNLAVFTVIGPRYVIGPSCIIGWRSVLWVGGPLLLSWVLPFSPGDPPWSG